MALRARIVRAGRLKVLKLPASVLRRCGLTDRVVLHAEAGRLIVTPAGPVRAGWAEAARRVHEVGDDRLLDAPTVTRFEGEAWRW